VLLGILKPFLHHLNMSTPFFTPFI